MENALEPWLADLEATELPALSSNLDKLKRLVADENVRITELSEIIEEDPGLTLRLLRRINAVRHRHLRHEITTVQHAVMMLGLDPLQSLPEGMPTIEAIESKPVRGRLRRLYSRAFHAAYQARDWARFHKEMEPDENFMAALLRNLAEMLFWMRAPTRMAQLEKLKHGDEMEAEEAEFVTFGFGLDQLTHRLALQWGLPSLVSECVQPGNAGKKRVLGIMLAGRLAAAAEKDWYTPEMTEVIGEVADFLPETFGETAARLHRSAVAAARESLALRVRPAAFRLLWPSRPEAEPGWEPHPGSEAGGSVDFCLCPQPAIFHSVLERFTGSGEAMRLQELLDLALQALHEGLGLNRVLFALLNPEKTELRARAALGAETDTRFNGFRLELEGGNLFSKLMDRPQALWLDHQNRDKFLPLLPETFLDAVRSDSFFAMSVFIRGQPVGLFYADRHRPECRLDSRAYHRFKQLVMQAARAMEPLVRK